MLRPRAIRATSGPRYQAFASKLSLDEHDMGPWILITVLVAIFGGAVWVAYQGWNIHGAVDTPASLDLALVLMVVLTLIVGCGLMALVFYSSRKGYDELPQREKNEPPP